MWKVSSWWRPIQDYDPGPVISGWADEEEARQYGLRLTCLNGTTKVEVKDPSGALYYSWSDVDNIWTEHIPGHTWMDREIASMERAVEEICGYNPFG